jgi:hypothetical protein
LNRLQSAARPEALPGLADALPGLADALPGLADALEKESTSTQLCKRLFDYLQQRALPRCLSRCRSPGSIR